MIVQSLFTEQSPQQKTHLFMVRLWTVSLEQEKTEVRGKVQHVLTGETQYFGDWHTLRNFLISQSAKVNASSPD
jgi:hypothetical protein